jgi:hypothetical protein
MNETTRKLLAGALSKHEACLREIAEVHEQKDAVQRLVDIERVSWMETPWEVENRPMTYRHLLSLVHDLSLLEQRYAACEHEYLKTITAQRYWEALGDMNDMTKLMELANQAHPGLRVFAVLRFQERLPDALRSIHPTDVPKWFTHLLMQPSEMANFLSQSSCKAVIDKTRALLAADQPRAIH